MNIDTEIWKYFFKETNVALKHTSWPRGLFQESKSGSVPKKKKKKNPVDLSEDREKSPDKIQSVCFRS